MGYTKRIVCLAVSHKHGGLCIAGRELTPHGLAGWIRPISNRPTAELTYLEYRYPDGSSPKLLDVVDIPLLLPCPHCHQTENHRIDHTKPWTKVREIAFRQLRALVEDPPFLWCNQDHTAHGNFDCVHPAQAAQFRSSLYLIQKAGLSLEVGPSSKTRQTFRGIFDHHGVTYNLSLTGMRAREHFEATPGEHQLGNTSPVYLTISLTEPYPWDRRCHKLIAAILTDPPL